MNQTLSKPYHHPNPNPNPPDPYVSMLQDSIHRFIADYRNSVTDFSNFSSIFSRLLQTIPDPPLEIIWFYSAVTFRTAKFNAPATVAVVKDLFQLLVSCSASCRGPERIAVLAPVAYELRNLSFGVEEDHCEEEEVRSLLEGLISYISISCSSGNGWDGDGDGLSSCFLDVVRVWVVDRVGVGGGGDELLKVFFPIVSDEARNGMKKMVGMGCGVGYLAGVVMCESFLLNLCFKFGLLQTSRAELEKEVRSWVAQTLTGFRCFPFYETLFRTLLEPVLPVANLLNYKDQCLLQEVLYDSVIMVNYSFLKPQIGIQLPSERLKSLAITWLLVADNGIRNNDDQSKVISYLNAFTESCLASHLITWLTNQTDTEERNFRPNFSTPVALIKWMLLVEERGVRVFDCEISKLQAKGVICKSRVEYVLPETKPDEKTLASGDLVMVDSVDNVSMAINGIINTVAFDGTRKRKGTVDGTGTGIQVKFVKYHFDENSVKKGFHSSGSDGSLSSESEVDNPDSDRAMEDMEQ
ncbi:uncharacterized protein LOC133803617 isoform X2 [Humulus lupulus]|uniref:uncharacterized protein LOC133803617 isoform X2 n=1 Tax=Humulus lupulus TaxID=3486 RepID=UPI002B415A2D|nr:uncharacterized protein LOC133803617 isoform X2 [Humulus lupulus]